MPDRISVDDRLWDADKSPTTIELSYNVLASNPSSSVSDQDAWVTVDYRGWPALRVQIDDPLVPFVFSGVVLPINRVVAISTRIRSEEWRENVDEMRGGSSDQITALDFRSVPIVSLLREWAEAVRPAAARRVAGDEIPLDVHLGDGVKQALARLRAATHNPVRRERARARNEHRNELLHRVRDLYLSRRAEGDPSPRVFIASELGYSTAHIGRLLVQLRDQGLLEEGRRKAPVKKKRGKA